MTTYQYQGDDDLRAAAQGVGKFARSSPIARISAVRTSTTSPETAIANTMDSGGAAHSAFAQLVPNESKPANRAVLAGIGLAWVAIIVLGFFGRLPFGLEDDELQHLHMAWRIGQHDLPYRDFFEHHPPLWHMVLGPFIADRSTFAHTPLFQLRAFHAGVLALLAFSCFRVLRRLIPTAPATWGAGLFLISGYYVSAYYDIRPDWIALWLLVEVILFLSAGYDKQSSATAFDESKPVSMICAGLLAGIAALLTQKSWFMLVGIAIWLIGTACLAPADVRRQRWKRLWIFVAATATPMLVMYGYFIWQGAAWQSFNDLVLVNLRWPRERVFAGFVRATTPVSAGLFALAATSIITTLGDWPGELRRNSLLGLLTTTAVFGSISYMFTPVPYEQSFLFLSSFWLTLLAVDVLWKIVEDPLSWRKTAIMLTVFVLAMSAGSKGMSTRIITAASWMAVLGVVWLTCFWFGRNSRALRGGVVLAAMSVVGAVWVIRDNVLSLLHEDRGKLQAQMYTELENRLGPDGQLITLWPPALPFRRHATFYPFGHEPMLQLFAKDVERQYLEATARNVPTLIVGYDQWLSARMIPQFDAVVRKKFRFVNGLPKPQIIQDAYERIPDQQQ